MLALTLALALVMARGEKRGLEEKEQSNLGFSSLQTHH